MEKINIAELLKDCPQGMELDCTMYDNVVLEFVANVKEDTYPIKLKTKKGTLISTTEYGCYDMCSDAKCVIFPKGKTSWEGFHRPFKDGDILSYQFAGFKNRSIYIYRNHPAMNTSYYVALSGDLNFMISSREGCALNGNNSTARLATEEEKTKLFQAIKDNGYKWNEETKTLEKLVKPEFKDGDIAVTNEGDIHLLRTKDSSYCAYRERWEGLPKFDKTITTSIRVERLATEEEKAKFFDVIKANGYKWNPETKTLVELPNFKVGDRIRHKNDKTIIKTIGYVYHDSYALCDGHLLLFTDQDIWELAP